MLKPAQEWDWEFIKELPVGEYNWLEAKGLGGPAGSVPTIEKDKVKKTLDTEICALANSGGGQLIWGLSDRGNQTGWTVENGGVPDSVGRQATSDWLETMLPPLTDPPLQNFNVYTIRDSPDLRPAHAIYVIDIADSSLAPHQVARDNKYYGRIGSRSVPLSHQFVLDILGRRKNPKLSLDCTPAFRNNHNGERIIIQLTLGIKNDGRVTARFPAIEISDSGRFQHSEYGLDGNRNLGLPQQIKIGSTRLFAGGSDNVVFPGQTRFVTIYQLEVANGLEAVQSGSVRLDYSIFADGFFLKGAVGVNLESVMMRRTDSVTQIE